MQTKPKKHIITLAKFLALTALAFALTNCATIIDGHLYDISITSNPQGASVTITKTGGGLPVILKTPASTQVDMAFDHFINVDLVPDAGKTGWIVRVRAVAGGAARIWEAPLIPGEGSEGAVHAMTW